MKQQRNVLPALLARMDGAIDVAGGADLTTTVALLRLARHDLVLRAKGLAADDEGLAAAVVAKAEAKSRPRKRANHRSVG